MNDQEIMDKLQQLARDVLGKKDLVLEKRTKLQDIGVSSFGMVQLVCAIEDEFDIEIPNTEIKSINSVSAAVRYIKRELKRKKQIKAIP